MFTPEERQVFPLRRGGVEVRVDPMLAWRAIYDHLEGEEMATLLQAANEPDPRIRMGALGRLAAIGRAAFGLEPVSPDGSAGDTEAHAIATLYRFFAWEVDLKNGPGRTPNGPAPSASSPDPSTT